ncbi:MAG: GNAT family N-acetyltransferase [Eubacteriales bacterium]|nr:GNAT family N-acetyltransferase [Eubacteriales bacterium]
MITISQYKEEEIAQLIAIWNEVVEDGTSFPQMESLDEITGKKFFHEQTYTGVAKAENGEILGLYILHPNNIGRCGHISNASYAVGSKYRGIHVGEKLVLDCISQAKAHGFAILQFNAVVKTNFRARHLYEKLGFVQLGTIPGGFLMKDGYYEDICPYYKRLIDEPRMRI